MPWQKFSLRKPKPIRQKYGQLNDGDDDNVWTAEGLEHTSSDESTLSDRKAGDTYEMRSVRKWDTSSTAQNPLLDSTSDNNPSWKTIGRRKSLRRYYFSGWRVGVSACALTASFVCLLNIVFTIVGGAKYPPSDGISALYNGSCTRVTTMSFWAHLFINIMSTLLLSGSNYTMQILASPTRAEVDIAHAKSRWLDIGIPSVRNLRNISRSRVIMWCFLGLSSVPLHLLYNTAVFSSIAANNYVVAIVTEGFVNGASWNESRMYMMNLGYSSGDFSDYLGHLQDLAQQNGLVNKTAVDCISAYTGTFISKTSNVLLVTRDANASVDAIQGTSVLGAVFNDAVQNAPVDTDVPDWICMGLSAGRNGCSSKVAKKYASQGEWKYSQAVDYNTTPGALTEASISYCLVQETDEHCQLNFSVSIMVIVIIVNMIKAVVMITTVLKLRAPALATVGDAIATFLDEPDPTTKSMCLATKDDFSKGNWKKRRVDPVPWVSKRPFWFRAASFKRWFTCNLLCSIVIITGIILLKKGIKSLGGQSQDTSLKGLWEMGIGGVNLDSVVELDNLNLTIITLLANLPQTILSFLYLTYNGIFSCVLAADEWNRFSHHRKRLRVTAPTGKQRSTYFLAVPYKYSIPLMIMSGLLHWFLSQSLFMIRIVVYSTDSNLKALEDHTQLGYSCIAVIFAIILGSIAVAFGLINGFRRYRPGIPLVGSCSAAISAACHMVEPDHDVSLKPLRWGAVPDGKQAGDMTPGHCSFSCREVEPPILGRLYAGVPELAVEGGIRSRELRSRNY